MHDAYSNFEIDWGEGFGNPLTGQGNYRLLEHYDYYDFAYLDPDDDVVYYTVFSEISNMLDVVVHYENGLKLDTSVSQVWDF